MISVLAHELTHIANGRPESLRPLFFAIARRASLRTGFRIRGQRAEELLAKLRDLSAPVLAMARAALDIGRRKNFEATLNEIENLYLHELMRTVDANEGVQAFVEKRKPKWRNK